MKLLKLLEDIISKDNLTVNIKYNTRRTSHSIEREKRDGTEPISKKEIIDTVKRGMSKIVLDMVLDKINIDEKIVIQDTQSNLNIVGVVERKGKTVDFVIVTLMRKKEFRAKPNTHIIKI